MSMRVVLIGPLEQAAIARLVAFASRPENHYPAFRDPVPGYDARYVLRLGMIGDVRCVFTFTEMPDGKVYRHLSVSVPDPSSLPNVALVRELARAFGFVQPAKEWLVGPDVDGHALVVIQFVGEKEVEPCTSHPARDTDRR